MNTQRATTACSILVISASLAGCTGNNGTPATAATLAGSRSAAAKPVAVLAAAGAATVVAPGRTPAEIAAAVSRSLFRSSPVVVVAPADDPAALTAGASEAERLGVPMLLVDGTGGSTPGPSATGTAAPAGTPTATEIARLGPSTVLALGTGTADRLGATGAKIVTAAGDLPDIDRPQPLPGTAVLVSSAGAAKAAVAAVSGTAKAAGARPVPVDGIDPRTDSTAIDLLAAQKPARVIAAGTGFGTTATLAARLKVAATGVQLPGGGQVVLPGRRLVAMYGYPGSAGLGVLGEQPLPQAIARAKKLAAPYQPLSGQTPVVPTFELIATVAQSNPGAGNDYSYEAPVSLLKPWVDAAGKAGMYVVLDLQPGRANFLDQAKTYAPLLKLPHVGLALDPEWRITDSQLPLQQIGSARAAEINSVYRWLADLTAASSLPQKLFVIHEFKLSMVGDDEPLQHDRDQVQLLVHMDGQGPTGTKDSTWAAVVGNAPKGVPFGWKNFYDEDSPMLTPAQTMTRKPTPSMISYQ